MQKRKDAIYYENVKDIEKVQIIDEHTIRIELSREVPFFEYYLIFPIINAKENEKQIPIGTGKYKIVKLEKDKIELTQNENYREEENSNIKNISITLYNTIGEIYNDFKLGNIDLFHTANQNIEEYIGSMGYGKKVYAGREYDYLALNCEDSLLQYKEVRKAISYAVDKKRIIATSLEDKAELAQLPLEGTYLTKEVLVSSDKQEKEKAKKVLEEAGWKYEYGIWQKQIAGRTKTLNITLTVSKSNTQRVKVANEIKKQLEEIGIKIKLQEVSDNKYKNDIKNSSYEMILTGVYSAISPDLTGILGKGNLANYQNQEVENILKELNNITEENLRKEKYKRLFEIYEEEVPYISLYRNQEFVIYNTTFRGEITPNHYNIYYHFSNWYRQD